MEKAQARDRSFAVRHEQLIEHGGPPAALRPSKVAGGGRGRRVRPHVAIGSSMFEKPARPPSNDRSRLRIYDRGMRFFALVKALVAATATSMAALGVRTSLDEVSERLTTHFGRIFDREMLSEAVAAEERL